MADSPKMLPDIHVDTVANLSSITGLLGQRAIADDTMVEYVYDNTGTWIDKPVRKLSIASGTPNLALGSSAGTGATRTIEGDNLSGIISITTGASVSTSGPFFTFTLADGASFASNMLLHLQSIGTNPLDVVNSLVLASSTGNSITYNLKGLSLSAATPYKLAYLATGYKK